MPVAELEKMIAEAMAVHLYREAQADRTVSLWVSPSFLTQLVRRINTDRPFSEPIYNSSEWYCSYELYFKGELVYSFKELVWSPTTETVTSKLTADDKIAMPTLCYQELMELQSSGRVVPGAG